MAEHMDFTSAPDNEEAAPAPLEGLSLGEVSPYTVALSMLQDKVGPDATLLLHAFVQGKSAVVLDNFAATLARIGKTTVSEKYVYLPPDQRILEARSITPLGSGANPLQVVAACRMAQASDTGTAAEKWDRGMKLDARPIMGGFEPLNPHKIFHGLLTETVRVKYAERIDRWANPLSAKVHAWVVDRSREILAKDVMKQPDSSLDAWKKGLSEKYRDIVISGMTKLGTISSQETSPKEGLRALIDAQRAIASTALQAGRLSRQEDNFPALTTPWYRYQGVPKAVARTLFILELTRGKGIRKCNVPAFADAFPNANGWNLMFDIEKPPNELIAIAQAARILDSNRRVRERCALQVNVLKNFSPTENVALIDLLMENKFIVPWSLHDGHLFLVNVGDEYGADPTKLPYVLENSAAMNNQRTLHAHLPLVDTPSWKPFYAMFPLGPVPIPLGGVVGIGVEEDDSGDSRGAKRPASGQD